MRTRTRNTLIVSACLALLLLGAAATVDAAIIPKHSLGLHDAEKTIRSIDLQQESFPFEAVSEASPTTLSIVSPPASGHAYIDHGIVGFLPDLEQNTTVTFTAEVGSLTDASKKDTATFTYHVRGLAHADSVVSVSPGEAASYDVATSFVGYPTGPVNLVTTNNDESEADAGILHRRSDGSADWRPTDTRGTFHIDYSSGVVTFTADTDFTGTVTYQYQARVGAQLVTGSATFRADASAPRPRSGARLGLRPLTAEPVPASGVRTVRLPSRDVSAASATVNPAAGTVTAQVGDDGGVDVSFTPSPGFAGDAVASVTADAASGSQTTQVTFPVSPLGAAPKVVSESSGGASVDVAAAFPSGTAPMVTGAAVSPAGAGSVTTTGGVVRFVPTPGVALPGGAAVAIEYTVAGRHANMTVNIPRTAAGAPGGGSGPGSGSGGGGGSGSGSGDGSGSGSGSGSDHGPGARPASTGSGGGTPKLADTGSDVSLLAAVGAVCAVWVGLLLVVAGRRRAAAYIEVPRTRRPEETRQP